MLRVSAFGRILELELLASFERVSAFCNAIEIRFRVLPCGLALSEAFPSFRAFL
jgi:hypothetical protein